MKGGLITSSMDKQLNVWIDGDLKDTLAERAQQEKKSMKDLVEDILTHDMARYRGEIIEQQALPVIRDIIQSELRKALAQLLIELREDVHSEIVEQMKTISRRSDDRIAALVVRAVRDGGIIRRLVYTLIAKSYGAGFAKDAYDRAKEKAGQELAERATSKRARTSVDEEQEDV